MQLLSWFYFTKGEKELDWWSMKIKWVCLCAYESVCVCDVCVSWIELLAIDIARQSLEQRQHVLANFPISLAIAICLACLWSGREEECRIVFPLCSFNYKSNSIMQLKRLISQAMWGKPKPNRTQSVGHVRQSDWLRRSTRWRGLQSELPLSEQEHVHRSWQPN